MSPWEDLVEVICAASGALSQVGRTALALMDRREHRRSERVRSLSASTPSAAGAPCQSPLSRLGAGASQAQEQIGPLDPAPEQSREREHPPARPAQAFPLLRLLALAALAAIALYLILSAAEARAESVWWRLTSGTRPATIAPGHATNEIRRLSVTASAGTYRLEEPVLVNRDVVELHITPKAGESFIQLPFNAGAGEVRAGLEQLYGSANVKVIESAPKSFQITFKAARADQPVELKAAGEASLSTEVRGRADGEIYLTAENLGNQSVSGQNIPIHLKDTLPGGYKAVAIAATKPSIQGEVLRRVPLGCDLQTLSCTLGESLAPYDQLELRVLVVAEEASSGEQNTASIAGGEGFSCQQAPGKGKYSDSGCMDEVSGEEEVEDTEGKKVKLKRHGNFERSYSGPAPEASLSRAITLKEAPAPAFGVEDYELTGEEEGGASATQAAKHPFQLTTTIALNQGADARPPQNFTNKPSVNPIALPKDLYFNWPPGLIGNPRAFPQCTDAQFYKGTDSGRSNLCPPASAVGVATVIVNEPSTAEVADLTVPVFNLKPREGEPARFGFNVISANAPVVIDTAVRAGSDYGVTVQTQGITQTAAFLASEVTIWGVPGALAHNRQRGWACLEESRGGTPEGLLPCSATETKSGETPPAFLSLPSSCTGTLPSTVLGDSWSDPLPSSAFPTLASASLPALSGCNRVPFSASMSIASSASSASSPTGLSASLHVPQAQTLNPNGLAEGAVKDIAVSLPEGLSVNPAAADGLQACSESLASFIGFTQFVPPNQSATFTEASPHALEEADAFCPSAAKVGTAQIKSPVIEGVIEGGVYLAAQNQNPFASLLALYILAEDKGAGVAVKLAGEVKLSPSGQISTTFLNSPQAPFEDATLQFFEGQRASLSTPAKCGTYEAHATLAPWSGNPPASAQASFAISSGPNGGACPGATLPFAPSLAAGTNALSAGAYAPLSTTIERGDGQQALKSVQLHTPPGLAGILTGVPLCPEAQANSGTCPQASQIGQSTVAAGVGQDPVVVPGGRVFLTEGYAGAPFGLSITEPVKAGPFDLERDSASHSQPACDCLVVRARIEVDPHTAALTVTTDQIPSSVDNIAVQVRKVNVTIDRPSFTFNPSTCNPLAITATIAGYEGALSPLSSPFQAANCQGLKFAPKFSVQTSAHTSKADGAALNVKIAYPPGPLGTYSNIQRTKVSLPKELPSRLTTLNKACVAAVFEANPANCPKESIVGHATARTPVLPVPLEGNAYFVSHAAEAFPDLTLVLKGYGITIDLVGSTQIKKGITTSTFKAVPDAPISSFELSLPQGRFSALTANASLCAKPLYMPTELAAQNGLVINQQTRIAVSGCAKALTKRQKLAKALAACHRKKNKGRRKGCEVGARRRER
jgi:hypothetical protein